MSNAEPVVVKNADIFNLLQGLQALDGQSEIAKGAGQEGKDLVVNKPYEINGRTRIRLGKWLTSVANVNKTIQDSRIALIKQYCKGAGPEGKDADKVPPEKLSAFNDDWNNAMEETTSFPHAKVSVKDVLGDKEQNALSITVLAALEPILAD
jgi:hypothetical protein